MSTQEVVADQRERLIAAAISLAAEGDVRTVSTRELCIRAKVSTRDLYRNFAGAAHDVMMACLDEIAYRMIMRMALEWERSKTPFGRVQRGLRCFLKAAADEPESARFAMCETIAYGSATQQGLRVTEERLGALLASALRCVGARAPEPLMVAAAFGGIGAVVRARLLAHAEGRLPAMGADLSRWMWSCIYAPAPDLASPANSEVPVAAGARTRLPGRRLVEQVRRGSVDERMRAMAAAAAIAAGRDDVVALTTDAVHRISGLTRRAISQRFSDEADLLCETASWMWRQALPPGATEGQASGATRRSAAAEGCADPKWEEMLRRKVVALMICLSEDDSFTRAALLAPYRFPAKAGLEVRLRLISKAAGWLLEQAPPGRRPRVAVAEASVAAAWRVACESYRKAGARGLAAATPTTVFLALVPFVGAARAAQMVGADPLPPGPPR